MDRLEFLEINLAIAVFIHLSDDVRHFLFAHFLASFCKRSSELFNADFATAIGVICTENFLQL